MKEPGTLACSKNLLENCLMTNEPESLKSEMDRFSRVLEATYKAVSLETLVQTCQLLSKEEQRDILHLLHKYEHLFDGALGGFHMHPIGLTLSDPTISYKAMYSSKEPGAKVEEGSYQVSRIGVLEEDYNSEWASPSFAIPKKNGTKHLVSDFRKVNSLIQ
jgi:hypothetical protein